MSASSLLRPKRMQLVLAGNDHRLAVPLANALLRLGHDLAVGAEDESLARWAAANAVPVMDTAPLAGSMPAVAWDHCVLRASFSFSPSSMAPVVRWVTPDDEPASSSEIDVEGIAGGTEVAQRCLEQAIADIVRLIAESGQNVDRAPRSSRASSEHALALEPWRPREAHAPQSDRRHGHFVSELCRRLASEPTAVAMVHGDVRMTNGELLARSHRIAGQIQLDCSDRSMDVRDARIAVAMPSCFDTCAVVLGVLRAGATCIVLDPDSSPSRHAQMGAESAATLVLTPTSLAALSFAVPAASPRPVDAIALVLFTSCAGPVVVHDCNLEAFSRWYGRRVDLERAPCQVHPSAFASDAIIEIFPILLARGTILVSAEREATAAEQARGFRLPDATAISHWIDEAVRESESALAHTG